MIYSKIPKTMSTQHPDNARVPEWASGEFIAWEDEVYEAYYVFSELGAQEQMWDWEGKDVDPRVVRKLLETFPEFFREHVLGVDVFLTYRVPNPSVEGAEKKGLVEALESIPFSYDVATKFYGDNVSPPVFEVILPLTRSHEELLMVLSYYKRLVVSKGRVELLDCGVTVADWIGDFKPHKIEVIPLIEDMESLLAVDRIVGSFIRAVRPPYLRVFIARSDPALNYGLMAAVVLSKVALAKLAEVQAMLGTPIFAIIGASPPPFRGNLSPPNVERFLGEYGYYWTATIQSAFKYDYEPGEVRSAIEKLNRMLGARKPEELADLGYEDIRVVESLLHKLSASYRSRIEKLHVLVREFSQLIPRRRARRLHVGLYGYSRSTGRIKLPRAIRFTATLYSLGLPPEILGVEALLSLTDAEWDLLSSLYVNWRHDLEDAARRVCWDNLELMLSDTPQGVRAKAAAEAVLKDLETLEGELGIKTGPRSISERRYNNEVNNVLLAYADGDLADARRSIERAAEMRKFLG